MLPILWNVPTSSASVARQCSLSRSFSKRQLRSWQFWRRKGKPYIYGLAFTFGAYVLYDLARLLQWDVQGGILSGLFLLATITALIAVWGLYREERSD